MELKQMELAKLRPYENNPRKNDRAVTAVMESIKQCGYVAPIIVDEDMVILAGHTRYKALKKLGRTEAEVVIKAGLSEEQKRKYRLLDNKTNEFAEWDLGLLAEEQEGLDFDGFDFGFGLDEKKSDKYTKKTSIVQYEPSGEAVELMGDCVDDEKARKLIYEISRANVTEDEKLFLKMAASRHIVFNYKKIAEYYATATPEMQRLMEDSALVIIDYEDAIEKGYVKLSKRLREMRENAG